MKLLKSEKNRTIDGKQEIVILLTQIKSFMHCENFLLYNEQTLMVSGHIMARKFMHFAMLLN